MDITQLVNLPVSMKTVNFGEGLTGDVGNIMLNEGMQTVYGGDCEGLTGKAEG